jgi:phage tail protein X
MNADPMVADYAQLLRAGVTITFEDIVGPAKTGNSVNFIHETLLGLSGGKDKKTK